MDNSTDKPTAEVMNELIKVKTRRELEKLEQYTHPDPVDYFDELLKAKNLNWSKAFVNADMNDSYGRSVKSGRNAFNRNMICRIALGNNLTIDETKNLLKYSSCTDLYAKNERDKLIIFAITNHLSIAETNEFLESNGQKLL